MKLTIKSNFNVLMFMLIGVCNIISASSQACEMSRETKQDIYIQTDSQLLHYGNGPASTGPITSNIYKCQKSYGKYLMFSIGAKRPQLVSDVSNILYDGKIAAPSCKIKNSNFSTTDGGSVIADDQLLKQQFAAIRKCTYIRVRELNRLPLQFVNQSTCKIRQQTNGTATMEGDYCFIKVNPSYELQISTEIKQDCLKPDYLAYNNIKSQDIDMVMNAWIAPDATGYSSDAEYLRSIPVKLSILPSKKIMSVYESVSKPEIAYPSKYSVDINPGPIEIQKTGDDRYNFDFSLEVKNMSKSICKNGLPCAGASDFQSPVAGEVVLNQVVNGQLEEVQTWSYLAAAPSQWQGLLKNLQLITIEKHPFKVGQQYEISFNMQDPYEDFKIATKRVEAIKFNLPVPNETLDNIQNTPIMDSSAILKDLGSLPSSMVKRGVETSLDQLESLLHAGKEGSYWPQPYDYFCAPGGRCDDLRSSTSGISIVVRFTVLGFDQNTQKIKIGRLGIEKNSSVLGSYKKNINALPELTCGAGF